MSPSYLYFPAIDFIMFVIYNSEIILLMIILWNFNLHKGKEACLPHSILSSLFQLSIWYIKDPGSVFVK